MPQLPMPSKDKNDQWNYGCYPDKDEQMFEDMINNPDLQVDEWKIYNCETIPFHFTMN